MADLVCVSYSVSGSPPSDEAIVESARRVCPATWGGAETADVEVVPLTGGITNVLFKLTLRDRPEEAPLIVRLFGQGTELFVDRQRENIIFRDLSLLGIGSPPFHGLFENGRVEGFLDARSIKPEEMHDPHIYSRVATALGKFHSVGPKLSDAVDRQPVLFPKLEAFFDLAQNVSFDNDVEKQSLLGALNLPLVRAGLLAQLASQHADRTKSALALFQALPADAPLLSEGGDASLSAAVLATQSVLCHNDLLSGNILLSNNPAQLLASSKEGVTLIDFEYAGFNPRAYDLANHFNEFAGFDFDIANQFPTEEVRYAYLAHYLDAAAAAAATAAAASAASAAPTFVKEGGDEHAVAAGRIFARWAQLRQGRAAGLEGPCLALVAALDRCVLHYLPASHVFWASWSIVQAANSTIDFDFLSYSRMRLDAVAFHRNLFST